jgi:carbon storage regulator
MTMLVLTRRIGETIDIADGLIKIVIISQGENAVRLGIEAPKDIEILRPEAIKKTKQAG